MKFFLLFFLVLILSPEAKSQSLDEFYDKQAFAVYYRNTHINHLTAYRDTSYSYNYWSIYFDYRHSQTERAGLYYYWDPVVYHDLLGMVIAGMFKPKGRLMNKTLMSSGWLGWHNLGGNFIGKDKFVLAAGLNFSDFVLVSESDSAGIKIVRSPSAGYHFSVGPFVNADYLLTGWLGARCGINYNYSFANWLTTREWQKGYKKPHFLVITPEIFTKLGLFFRMSFTSLKSRADNLKINRREMLFGWRFHF